MVFTVTFNVQADSLDEAVKQAHAYVQTPSYAPCNFLQLPALDVTAATNTLDPLPHLKMRPCNDCGKRFVDDGWAQFCGAECAGEI